MIEQEYRQKLDEYIISQLRGKAGVKETLDAIAQQYNVLQDDLNGLLNWTSIDTAEGDLLDYIGYLFGITRDYFDISQYFCLNVDDINRSKYFFFREASSGNAGGSGSLSDMNFRSRIKAKIGLKFSNHTRNENIKIIKNMTFADDVHITALNDFQYTKSNCLINIPQDIKLELNEGVLTLKAGSKLYVPNGFKSDGTTPKFDIKVVESDISQTFGSSTNTDLIFLKQDNTFAWYSDSASGTTPPSTGALYNTSLNKVQGYNGGSLNSDNNSLPFCLVTLSSGSITSIDQIFNGFGYVGSTEFALPGVKGLMPDGYFPDGSIRNIEYTVPTVLTYTKTGGSLNLNTFFLRKDNSFSYAQDRYTFEVETEEEADDLIEQYPTSTLLFYITGLNKTMTCISGVKSYDNYITRLFDVMFDSNFKVTSFDNLKTVETDYSTGSQMMLNIDLIGDPNKMFITDKTLAEIEGVLGYGVGLNALTINGV